MDDPGDQPEANSGDTLIDEGGAASKPSNSSGKRVMSIEKGGRGWYFPEMYGPDLSIELYPGEHEFWETLRTKSINQIFGDESDPDDIRPSEESGTDESGTDKEEVEAGDLEKASGASWGFFSKLGRKSD